MELIERYLRYVTEICEGTRPAPEGVALHATGEMEKAMELQKAIAETGIPGFIRRCAEADGETIPREELDGFEPAAFLQALQAMAGQSEPEEPTPPPAKSEIREIYEVFLDSVCLEDTLVQYLIEILKKKDRKAFETLSHAAARTILDMDDFLAWLGCKELLGDREEQACVAILDPCLQRLHREGQKELLAALLSGDETTFKLFRTGAPELVHLPIATYEWFCKYYLDRYYPLRCFLRWNGVELPSVGTA